MKLSSRKLSRGSKIELAMTSMIDVVFLLLIFFLVNASFQLTERDLNSNIQTKTSSARPDRVLLEPVIIEVVKSAGGGAYQVGNRHLTDVNELINLLKEIPNKGTAFLKVRDDAPFGMVASAIQACNDTGFPSVSYIPEER